MESGYFAVDTNAINDLVKGVKDSTYGILVCIICMHYERGVSGIGIQVFSSLRISCMHVLAFWSMIDDIPSSFTCFGNGCDRTAAA